MIDRIGACYDVTGLTLILNRDGVSSMGNALRGRPTCLAQKGESDAGGLEKVLSPRAIAT
jgi:hypothetical protein